MPTDWTQDQINDLIDTLRRIAAREVMIPLPGGQGWLGAFSGDYTRGSSDSNGTLNRFASQAISSSSLVNSTLIRVTDVEPAVVVTIASERAQYEGLLCIVKDETGDAGSHPIQIVGEGGETFDGEPDAWISTDRGYLVLYSDGSDWRIIWTDTMGDEAIGPDAIGPFHLQETGVAAGTYGSSTAIPVLTIDEDGRVDVATTATRKPFETGQWIPHIKSSGLAGAVRARGKYIGDASSGADELAHADAHDLFVMLWSEMTDAIATVPGGRGASAQADWDAHKKIRVPDTRGAAPFGRDDGRGFMTSSGWGSDPNVNGSNGGTPTVTLTANQMPSHTHTVTTSDVASTSHSHSAGSTATGQSSGWATSGSISTGANGADQAHGNVPPGFTVTWWLGL